MKTLEYDLGYIRAALDSLEEYLLSDQVFWPISANPPEGEPDFPQLTLDGVLLAQARLEAWRKTPDQADEVDRVRSDLDRQRTKWRAAWEEKGSHSYRMRVRMWGDFIQDYQNDPLENADRYAYEVRLRVMINLLEKDIDPHTIVESEIMNSLDGYLKSVLASGDFIWEAEIQSGFPRGVYWYLYGKLPAKKARH